MKTVCSKGLPVKEIEKIKRYYLCSNKRSFKVIYTTHGFPLPPSVNNLKKALFAGKYFSKIEKLKKWWLREENIFHRITKTNLYISKSKTLY